MKRNEMTFPNQAFFQQFLERAEAEVSRFRSEQSESFRGADLFGKQEDYKTALFLVPKSQRKAGFTRNIAEDVLTQWIFILPPLFPLVRVQLFWGNMRARPHSENPEWHKHCQTENNLCGQNPLLLPTRGFGIKKKYFYFPRLHP